MQGHQIPLSSLLRGVACKIKIWFKKFILPLNLASMGRFVFLDFNCDTSQVFFPLGTKILSCTSSKSLVAILVLAYEILLQIQVSLAGKGY